MKALLPGWVSDQLIYTRLLGFPDSTGGQEKHPEGFSLLEGPLGVVEIVYV